MAGGRAQITVLASAGSESYSMEWDLPRARWNLDDLFEMAREAAEDAGILSEITDVFTVEFRWRVREHGAAAGPTRSSWLEPDVRPP